jgi:hypothetical protein
MRKWRIPPRIKVLEAIGSIGDGRIEVLREGVGGGEGGGAGVEEAKVVSSKGDREYTVRYNPEANAIDSNDNGSVYRGYLGYPSIAFLMLKNKLSYDMRIAEALRGIAWKELNDKYRSYAKVEEVVKSVAYEKGVTAEEIDKFVDTVMNEIQILAPLKLEKGVVTLDKFF